MIYENYVEIKFYCLYIYMQNFIRKQPYLIYLCIGMFVSLLQSWEVVTETIGPQSQKYLLFSSLQKKFVDHYLKKGI